MKHKYRFSFSIFTATYNRGEFLKRIYDALCNQTYKSFEWIIIDDGSTDITQEVVDGFIKQARVPIKYKHQLNSGKHTCYDVALKIAEGRFFLPLDSDDVPLTNALEALYNAYKSIPKTERVNYSAVTGLCVDQNNRIIGDKFPNNIYDSTPLDLLFKKKVKGDKWGFQKTNIRREYSYPILPDAKFASEMKFYPEIAIFGEIGKKYKTRYINQPLKRVEYQTGGLSKSKIKNAYPKKLSALYRLNFCAEYLKDAPMVFIISAILYNRWAFHSHSYSIKEVNNNASKILVCATFPIGVFMFLVDKIKDKFS